MEDFTEMKKRIVLINSCKGLYGGVESFLLNVFYHIDIARYDVRFLTCGQSTYKMFETDIIDRGGKIDEIPIYADSLKNQIKLYNSLRMYFRKINPDIVHINSGGLSFHYIASKAARKEGIGNVILHSHNFIPGKRGIKEVAKEPIKNIVSHYGNRYLACSAGAARWIFPEKLCENKGVEIIPNGIDTKRFAYNMDKRIAFRKEFGLDNNLVIGNIGRFQAQKNHEFIIKIMKEVSTIVPDAKLLLAGEGELKNKIISMVQDFGLAGNVIFLGERKDMDAFLSAIDVFILPSLHEGLPIAAIEAQTAGARVLLSETITKETNITGNVVFLPILNDSDEKLWARKICESIDADTSRRKEYQKIVFNYGYDVEVCTKRMNQIYEGE